MSHPCLVLEELSFAYPGDPPASLFDSVSLELPLDRHTLIFGPNGCGRSTLAGLIAGLVDPGGGRVRLEGAGSCRTERGAVFAVTGYQLQGLTVREELEAGLVYRGLDRELRKSVVEEKASMLGLEGLLDASLGELDENTVRGILAAAFLVLEPCLLVLDFSLSMLNEEFRERMLACCTEPGQPSLAVLSQSACDLALLEGGFRLLLIEDRSLREIGYGGGGEPEALRRLASAGIRMPWYAELSEYLFSAGVAASPVHGSPESLEEEVRRYLAGG